MMKNFKAFSFSVFGLAALLAGVGCSSAPATNAQAAPPQAFPVQVVSTPEVAVNDSSDYVATLKSRDSAIVMPEVEGRITKIFTHSGDHVTAGAALMEIDPRKQAATLTSQEQNVEAQKATLAYAQQQYDREQGLYDAKVVSKQELDSARSARDNAKAQLQALDAVVQEQQVQLHYYTVIAPWNGIVGDIPVRVGDRVTTTTQLTTVDKPGDLEVYIYVPIERSGSLRMGMPVQILDSSQNVIADSRISFISPEVDSATQTVLAKAKISNNQDKLRQLEFIRARVIWGTHNGPVVPILAVSRIGGQFFAFVAEDQGGKTVAHQKPLKIGDTLGNNYVVLDGLKAGDRVITSGTQFLVDGMPVAPHG